MIGKNTHYEDCIEVNPEKDFDQNFDVINDKASDIENWINNLALLNQNILGEGFNYAIDVSMLSDEEENQQLKDFRIEKQVLYISHIANTCKFISI